MSRTKTLLLLTCTFLLVFASTPDFVKAPLRVKTDGINVSPDFSSFIHPSAAEMFEEPPASPLAITWQARAAVPATRYRTAGCGDTSGHFYVVGGWTNSVASNVVYQYFANGDSWRTVANLPYANTNHCAIFHPPTNKIFVFCGYNGATAMNWTQIYDIANDTWTLGASCFLSMLGTYGAAVGDSIFITGTDLSAFSLGLWCYRVSTNTWSYIGALPGTGASGDAAAYGNKVYFTGGWPSRDTVTMYELGVGVTPSFTYMPRGQHGHGTEEVNGKLWVFGGGQSWSSATAAVYSYDLSQGSGGSWATENSMISTRYAGAWGKMFYPDTWRLHAATGLTGVSTRFLLHERGTIPPPPPTDAMLLKINAPSSATPPNTSVNPNVTIRNAGTDTISNIPVTIWIDSAGVRIYNQSQTVTGPLLSGDTANVNFTPTFPVGPLGSGYVVTAFTALSGDLDPSNDTLARLVYLPGLIWTAMPPHPATSYRTGGCGDTMGHFYVYGGYTTTYSNQNTRYDVTSGTWTTLSNMLLGVMNITGDYDLARDRIYVPGGYSPYRNQLQIYDVAGDSWYYGANMPMTSSGSPCAVVGDTLWVISSSPTAGTLMGYSINTNSWFFGSPRPNCLSYSMLVAYGRKLYSVGGWSSDATAYVYDIATNTWTQVPGLPVGRHSAGLEVINNKIVCYGGGQSWSPPLNSAFVLDPTFPAAGWASENNMVYGRIGAAAAAVTYSGRTRLHAACGYTGSANVNEHEAGGFPVPYDVGVDAILAPTGIIPGDTLAPTAIVKNYGTQVATFDVWFQIDDGYADTLTVTALAAGAVDTLVFTDWLPGTGFFNARCSTMLATDQDNSNDARSALSAVANYIEDFEAQDGGFVSNNAAGWQHGTLSGGPGGTPQGNEAWATNRTGAYSNNADWTLTSVTYYALQDTPVVAYWHWYEIENRWDGYNVKYSTDGGTNWGIIHAWPGYGQPYDDTCYHYNAIPGESAYTTLDRTWKLNWMKVPVSNGQGFLLRWHFGSDGSVTYWGAAVDYVCGLGFDTIQPFARDVAVLSIDEPTEADTTQPLYAIKATAHNYGEVAETFNLVFDITGPVAYNYTDTVYGIALNSGLSTPVEFDSAHFTEVGTHNAVCYVSPTVPGDSNVGNDTIRTTFEVEPVQSTVWELMTAVPQPPSGKRPKSGTCMAGLETDGLIYYLKASNKQDFYTYDPSANAWTPLETIPKGEKLAGDGKKPKKGAAMAAYAPGKCVYVLRGNNTLGFWKYQADTVGAGDTIGWKKMTNFPMGAKKVKDGSGLVLVEKGGNDYLFASRGAKQTDFYLYDIAGDSWIQVKSPPVGLSGKTGYKKGTCMAYDGENVWVLQGYYGSFFKYNVEADSWTESRWYNYKTYLNRDGKKKKPKDGAAFVYLNDWIYMLKGGNTYEMWKIKVGGDTVGDWAQMDLNWDIPPGPRNKKVKGGGCMINWGSYFYAGKGKNTDEFYRHGRPYETVTLTKSITTAQGVMGNKVATNNFKLTIAPNPAINIATVRYTLPVPGPVNIKLYNVTGALVKSHTITNPTKDGVFFIDAKGLPSGVYILRFNAGDIRVTRKMVLEK